MAKIARMSLDGRYSYDANDAAHYLHRYIQTHNKQPIPMNLRRHWAKEYGRAVSGRAVAEVNLVYRELFHKDGVADLKKYAASSGQGSSSNNHRGRGR